MLGKFNDIIDKKAPKQKDGSPERRLALAIGTHITVYSPPEIVKLIRQREKDLLISVLTQFEKEKWADSTDALRAASAAIEAVTGKKWSWAKAIEKELSDD